VALLFAGGSDGTDLLRDGEELVSVHALLLVAGEAPSASAHAATLGGGGGAARAAAPDFTWTTVLAPFSVPPRSLGRCHSAVAVGSRVLFFGGGAEVSNTLAALGLRLTLAADGAAEDQDGFDDQPGAMPPLPWHTTDNPAGEAEDGVVKRTPHGMFSTRAQPLPEPQASCGGGGGGGGGGYRGDWRWQWRWQWEDISGAFGGADSDRGLDRPAAQSGLRPGAPKGGGGGGGGNNSGSTSPGAGARTALVPSAFRSRDWRLSPPPCPRLSQVAVRCGRFLWVHGGWHRDRGRDAASADADHQFLLSLCDRLPPSEAMVRAYDAAARSAFDVEMCFRGSVVVAAVVVAAAVYSHFVLWLYGE
jgi:hypothetical protein